MQQAKAMLESLEEHMRSKRRRRRNKQRRSKRECNQRVCKRLKDERARESSGRKGAQIKLVSNIMNSLKGKRSSARGQITRKRNAVNKAGKSR